jgi:hypothetical protein
MIRPSAVALGVLGLLVASGPAHAQDVGDDLRDIRQDRRDIRQDTRNLREDRRELRQDVGYQGRSR